MILMNVKKMNLIECKNARKSKLEIRNQRKRPESQATVVYSEMMNSKAEPKLKERGKLTTKRLMKLKNTMKLNILNRIFSLSQAIEYPSMPFTLIMLNT
jgi:hypothetical protein